MYSGVQRSKDILTRIRFGLGSLDDSKIPADNIYMVASQKQRDIAETCMVIESSMSLSIVANTGTYDLTTLAGNQTGFYRLKLLAPPLTDRSIIFELDVNEMDFYQRYTRVSTGLPIWYIRIWQGNLFFYPTPTSSATWTVYFYKSPTTTISKTVGPETPSSFDTALVYATLMEIDPQSSDKWMALYEQALGRAIESYRGTRTEMKQITYNDI